MEEERKGERGREREKEEEKVKEKEREKEREIESEARQVRGVTDSWILKRKWENGKCD